MTGAVQLPAQPDIGPGSRPRGKRRLLAWFALLLLFSMALRLPSFFVDVVDPDESAYILIGQSLADGHLPYTLAWDLKPPLGFLFYAAAVLVVPDSLAFVRFCGAGLVAASALLTVLLSLRLMPPRESLLAGFLTVMALSLLIPSGRVVMLEHVALVPMLGALLVLARDDRRLGRMLLAGGLLAVGTLVRTNLAVVPVAVLAALLLQRQRPWRQRCRDAVLVGLGGLAVALLSYLPYALTGRSELFLDSVFLSPLAYSASGPGYAETAIALAERAVGRPSAWPPAELLRLVFWALGLVGLLHLALERGRPDPDSVRRWTLLFAAASFVSLLLSNRTWGHYLLQVVPFFAVALAALVASLGRRGRLAGTIALAVLLFASMPLPSAYTKLVERARDTGSVYHGRSFALAAYLRTTARPEDSLFVTHDILVYWLSGRYPVLPVATFPGNLWNEYSVLRPLYGPDATTESVLQQVLCRAPTFIIVATDPAERGIAGIEPMLAALVSDYRHEAEVADRTIYRRLAERPPLPCPFPESE